MVRKHYIIEVEEIIYPLNNNCDYFFSPHLPKLYDDLLEIKAIMWVNVGNKCFKGDFVFTEQELNDALQKGWFVYDAKNIQ